MVMVFYLDYYRVVLFLDLGLMLIKHKMTEYVY